MKIADNHYVAIDYTLTLESGEQIDRSPEGCPLGFVTGTGRIIPGLESALYGREAGQSFRVTVDPEQGYGPIQEDLYQQIPRQRFPADAEIVPGMKFQGQTRRGPVALTVTAVDGENVTVDMNHPLAGKNLIFDVTVAEVRNPTAAESAPVSGGCACGPQEQSACGCSGPGEAGGCGSSSTGCCG